MNKIATMWPCDVTMMRRIATLAHKASARGKGMQGTRETVSLEYGWGSDRTVAHWLELSGCQRCSNLVLPCRTLDKFVHSKLLSSLT